MQIAEWLGSLGLAQYEPAFRDNHIETQTLAQITTEDLVALGVTSIGHRRKLLTAIAALREVRTDVAAPRDVAAASDAARPAPAPISEPSRAERRQLTVMFIDLVGSTELSQRLDPEEMQDVIRAYQSAVSAEIVRYEGHVAKLMGDGVLAYFGWPRAHEDDAERAVRAGLAAAAAIALLTTPEGKSLAARIGIATGLVVVGDLIGEGSAQEEAVVGETPNLAARLQALAEPNTVVIAEGTQRLVAGLFETVDLGRRELKGFATPVRPWRVAGEAGAESRFHALHRVATPLVGRAGELDLLLQRWQQARTGEGQVILLSGEPGIGKSRLIAELDERLGVEPYARLRYFCSPYHVNSALHPVIKQLERAAGLEEADSADAKLNKLEALLRQHASDIGEASLSLAALLSIDAPGREAHAKLSPQARKALTFTALNQQFEALAARQPVLMLVEDAHWIDPTTSEWLDLLIDSLQSLPAFLIVSFRPEFQPRWTRFSHVTALSLSRLGRDQVTAIVDRVANGKTLPAEVTDQILAKTEGVPLFVEELTKTVLESGLLADAGGHYVLSGTLPALAIPSTLQDSLMARLDRLDAVKAVAQIGACIGRAFNHRLLAAVTSVDDINLDSALQQLEKSELIFRRGIRPEATYTFKHALVRDTAYQSLLKSRRQQIHARIASTLEAEFGETAEAEPETLAHHYTAAGLAEQAVAYWLKAGQRALKRWANLEAAAHLARGLELVPSLPESESRVRLELSLQTATGVAMIAIKGWGAPEVLQAYSRARTLSEELGDKSQLFVAIRGESSYRMISGDLQAADRLGRQCLELGLELAQASGDSGFVIEAHHQLWATNFYMGNYDAALFHANEGIAAYDPDRHHALTYIYAGHDPGVCCRAYSAQTMWMRGNADQALVRSRETLTLAEREAHPNSMAQALLNLSFIHLMRREPDEGRRWAEKGIALTTEFVLPLMTAQARTYLGWALAGQGHVDEGISETREGVAAIAATGADMGMAYYFCVLARAYGERGEAGEGLVFIEKALGILAKSGSTYQLPDLLRTKGELLLRLNPRDDAAEGWLRQAVSVAAGANTKSHELRAALSLSRLCRARGRNAEARQILAPVYAWFTEGFDTPDLVEAKSLLGSLSQATAMV